MWRVAEAANRPWPVLCEDDVIDYLIMEAIALKISKENEDQEKDAKKKEWRKDKEGLNKLKGAGGG